MIFEGIGVVAEDGNVVNVDIEKGRRFPENAWFSVAVVEAN